MSMWPWKPFSKAKGSSSSVAASAGSPTGGSAGSGSASAGPSSPRVSVAAEQAASQAAGQAAGQQESASASAPALPTPSISPEPPLSASASLLVASSRLPSMPRINDLLDQLPPSLAGLGSLLDARPAELPQPPLPSASAAASAAAAAATAERLWIGPPLSQHTDEPIQRPAALSPGRVADDDLHGLCRALQAHCSIQYPTPGDRIIAYHQCLRLVAAVCELLDVQALALAARSVLVTWTITALTELAGDEAILSEMRKPDDIAVLLAMIESILGHVATSSRPWSAWMQHRTRVAVAEPACNLRQETVKQLVATMISLLSGSARPESQSALNARIACVNIVGIIAAEDAQVAQLLLSDLDSWAALVAALSVPLQPSLAAQRSTSFASVSSPTRQSLPRQISNSFMSGSAFASRSNSVADRETDVRLARSAVRLDVAIWTLDDFVKGALVQLASPSVDAAPLADQPSATAALVTPSTPTVARPSAVLSPLYPQTPPTEKLPATPKSTPITSILTQSSSEPYAVDALVRRILGSPYLLALPAAPATLPFAPQQAQQHLSAPPASSNDRQLYLGCVDTSAASRLVVMHGLPCSLNEADYVSKMSSIRSTGSQLPVHTSAELDLVFSIIKAGLLHTHPDNFDRGVVTLRNILAVFATDNVALKQQHAASFLIFVAGLLDGLQSTAWEIELVVRELVQSGALHAILGPRFALKLTTEDYYRDQAVVSLSLDLCNKLLHLPCFDNALLATQFEQAFKSGQLRDRQAFQLAVNFGACVLELSETSLVLPAKSIADLVSAIFQCYESLPAADALECRWTLLDYMSIIQSHASYPLASVILEVQMVTDFLFLQFRSTSSVALSASVDLVFKALGVILLCPMDSSPSLSITSKAVDVLERILSFFPRRIVSVEQVILHQKIIEGLIGLANGNNSYDSLEHAFQAAKLLENLLAVLLVDISLPRNKDSLSDASVFDAIGSLALKAIRHVLTHVPGCRQSFADMLGYHEIFERFRRRNLITDAFVTEFVDTICDRRPYNLTVFRDASSLEALLQLYTKFEPGHQLFIINKLAEACQSDITNFQIARKVRLLRFLLSVALPLAADEEHAATVVRLIKRLISFSSDVADAKALLMALKHRDGSQAAPSHSATATPGISDAPDHEPHRNSLGAYFLPFLHDEILRALVEAVQTNGASEHLDFFVFSQPHSGIVLPRIPRWPESPAKGYSLYISFRLSTEAFAVTVPSVLIAFAAESGSGMQLSIDSGMLVYTIVTKTDTVHTAKPQEIHVDPDTWYSVVVSHQVGMFNVSTATIHVNGACAWRGSMPFPHGEDSLRGVIGSRGAYDKDSYKPTDYFPGHVSSFALFNVVLSAEIIQSLHFGGEENLPIQPDLYNFQLLPPQQQPLLFAHPLAVKGSVCFNVSTHELAANQSPIVLHDVTCCSTRSFADALQSLGGIELLYPLLCQASLPVASIPQGSSSTAERLGPSIFYTSSPEERIVFVLSMICGMLSQNAYHMNRFVESDGVRLLSLLLQQSCLPCLSIRIFREILKLRRIPNASAELVNAVDEYLVFDPQIWSHAGQDVQRDYFAEIKALLAANTTGDLSQKYDIAFWLDAVEQFYSSHMLFVGETRAWAFVATLFGPPATLSYDHGQRVVESLWCSVHNPEARCLYRIFLDKSSPAHQVFAARIFESTGCDIVFRLLEGTDESIRQLCLDWILRMLLSDSPKHARLRRALVDVPPAVWTGLLRAHPLTDQVYYSLLRMATVSSIAAGKDAKEPTSIATPALDTPTDFSPRISQTGVPERVSTVSMSCDTTQGPPLEDSIASLLVRYPGFVKTMIELLAHCVDIDTGVLSNVWKDMLHLMALPSNLAALRPHLNCYSIIILLGKLALQANALTLATTVSDNPSSPSSSLPLRDNVPPPEMLAVILNLTTQTTDKDIIQANLVDEMLVLFWVLVPSNYADRMIQDWLLLVIDAITKRVESGVQLSDSDYQNLLRFVNTVDEFLFNKQDILDSLKFEYSDAMYNWQLLIQRHRTLHMPQFKKQPSADLAAKTSNPFEENPRLAVAHADLVNRLIQHKDMRPRKGFSFWQPILYPTDDQLSILAIRLLLNAFLSFDRDRWLSASSRLAVVLKSEELAVSDVPRPFALYALAIVYEAFKVQPEPIVDVCLVEALKLWSKVIESSASDITKALIDAACVPADAADARAESLGSGSSLSSFLGGDKWSAFADKHLYPAMRTYEDEWLSGVSNVTKKFTAAARTMLGRFGRDADVDQSVFSPVQQRLATVTGAKVEARTKRLAEKITSYESSTRQVANMWNRKSLELTFDRQIWASASPRSGPTYMKLDTYENHLRMRRRLTRNFDFHDHIDASMKRDKLAPQIASGGPGADARRGVPFMNKPSSLHSLSDRKKMLVDRMQRLQIDSGIRRDGSRASIVSEDDTEDEDWNLIAEEESSSGYDSQTERCVCTASSEMIVYMTSIKGRFEVTTTHLRFFPTVTSGAARPERSPASPSRSFLTPDTNATTDQKWPLSELQQVFLRRYKLHKSGLEFFFLDGHTFLFNFLESNGRRGSSERMRVLRKIIGLRPPSLRPPLTVSPEECMKRSGLTERWVRREITNFEYLMALNTYSGRTYNDLTQYPVFPWVLSDYKSPLIDLTDPSVYRDLTKPIGALNPARLAGFLERYNAFEDPEGQVKKFLYGSHYSSSASVLFYLLRLEPFTTLHVSLQGGKFDHPDRQFHSLASCWYSVFTSSSDVKELIPEFYYLPEFLKNDNGFDLGTTQSGHKLGDVVLPPWAASAEEFIRIQREALESDYVSDHLHAWVDLIWGYKQTGEAAVQAHNVFYYLTYEGAVSLDSIKDPMERRSIEDQINNFGQTPSQLFTRPHPQRLSSGGRRHADMHNQPGSASLFSRHSHAGHHHHQPHKQSHQRVMSAITSSPVVVSPQSAYPPSPSTITQTARRSSLSNPQLTSPLESHATAALTPAPTSGPSGSSSASSPDLLTTHVARRSSLQSYLVSLRKTSAPIAIQFIIRARGSAGLGGNAAGGLSTSSQTGGGVMGGMPAGSSQSGNGSSTPVGGSSISGLSSLGLSVSITFGGMTGSLQGGGAGSSAAASAGQGGSTGASSAGGYSSSLPSSGLSGGGHGLGSMRAASLSGSSMHLPRGASHDQFLVLVDESLRMSLHAWRPARMTDKVPFVVDPDPKDTEYRVLPTQLSANVQLTSQLIELSRDGRHMFVAGNFDLSFRVFQLEGSHVKFVDTVYGHRDVTTCLRLSEDGSYLATGSRDTTVRVWPVKYTRDKCTVQRDACRIYYGHDDQVTAVLVNRDNAVVVSGSADGTIMINSLFGSLCPISLRPVYPMESGDIRATIQQLLFVPADACIVALSQSTLVKYRSLSFLHRYSINGRLLCTKEFSAPVTSIGLSTAGDLVFAADTQGDIHVLSCLTFEKLYGHKSDCGLTSLAVYPLGIKKIVQQPQLQPLTIQTSSLTPSLTKKKTPMESASSPSSTSPAISIPKTPTQTHQQQQQQQQSQSLPATLQLFAGAAGTQGSLLGLTDPPGPLLVPVSLPANVLEIGAASAALSVSTSGNEEDDEFGQPEHRDLIVFGRQDGDVHVLTL